MSGCSALRQKSAHRNFAKTKDPAELRIGTYNVFIGTRDFRQTAKVIRGMNADVVALQEVSEKSATALSSELRQKYPHRYFSSGLGLMSRWPFRHPRFERSQCGINGFLFCEIVHPRGQLQIANLHLDPLRIWTAQDKLVLPLQVAWKQGAIHRNEIAQVMANLRPRLPTVLLGDFNRVGNAAIHRLRKIGFTDSFAAISARPDQHPTLHYSLLGFRSGRRIDFIFHDRAFSTHGSQILSGRPSDHDAVVSVLRWNHR